MYVLCSSGEELSLGLEWEEGSSFSARFAPPQTYKGTPYEPPGAVEIEPQVPVNTCKFLPSIVESATYLPGR